MSEGFRHEAGGGGEAIRVVRYGREELTQREATNVAGETVFPGEALALTTDANDYDAFEKHDGNEETPLYIAVEARGRGMNADTDDGYADGEGITAVRASGGGLNVKLAVSENVVTGDELAPEAGTGKFVTGKAFTTHQVDESLDLTGAGSAELVATEVTN